jgi:2-polyprenyl-6-methoxyphenol hydroxylase-like FAD-dependent oxidoreductase
MTKSGRQHAIVIGGSIAGLFAARVLADHFRKVTILDKDALPGHPTARDGVPQGRHPHVLLPAGAAVLDRLFPGGTGQLIREGAQPFDYGQSQFFIIGNWMPRIDTGLHTLALSRPFLEHHIRSWVSRIANVEIIQQANVTAPLWNESRTRVTGVSLESRQLAANLVIDATGRHTRLPRWLTESGYPNVPESAVHFHLGYATAVFRVPETLRPTHPMLYIVGPPPQRTRVGVRLEIEGNVVLGGVAGYHGDHPPSDLPGFLDFANSLSQPDVFDVLSRSELLSPIARFAIPSSNWRHYAKMARFPDGLLPIGDSICNFDPAFGQGITIAAQEAEALDRSLRSPSPQRDYFKRAEAIVRVAWDLSSGENFKYPQTTGRRPILHPVLRACKDRIANCADPVVVQEFYRVLSLTAPPRVLLHPRVVMRTLGLWR